MKKRTSEQIQTAAVNAVWPYLSPAERVELLKKTYLPAELEALLKSYLLRVVA